MTLLKVLLHDALLHFDLHRQKKLFQSLLSFVDCMTVLTSFITDLFRFRQCNSDSDSYSLHKGKCRQHQVQQGHTPLTLVFCSEIIKLINSNLICSHQQQNQEFRASFTVSAHVPHNIKFAHQQLSTLALYRQLSVQM